MRTKCFSHIRRLLIPTLTLVLLTLLCACGGQTEPPAPPADSTAVPEPVPDCVIVGGEHTYRLIRAEKGDSTEIEAAQALQNGILTASGASLTLTDDWYRTEEEIPPYEILVGEVNRAETREAMAELHYHDFTVRMDGDKLVVLGATPAGTQRAVDYLLKNFVTDTGLTLPADFCYIDRGTYTADSISIDGIAIGEYSIVYEKSADLETAQLLRRILGEYCGINLPVKRLVDLFGDAATVPAPEKHLLVIGSTSLKAMEPAEFYAYHVTAEDGCIFFNGYDRYAYGNAFLALTEILKENGGKADASALTVSYTLPDRTEYLRDPDLLYMRWAAEWETPEWMLDRELKVKEIFGGAGTEDVWIIAHRADHSHYPENSLEAIISCAKLGVSVVELDLQATKDGVLVLMHDDTLTRMTNAADYVGKEGYPSSSNVSEWTYSQLQELCLKEGQGGSGAKLTVFKIPTFEEALIACKDKLFIIPDKIENWRYISTVSHMTGSLPNYLYDLMEKTGNYTSVLVSYGMGGAAQAYSIQQAIQTASGQTPFIFLRGKPSSVSDNYSYLSLRAAGTFAFHHGGYDSDTNYNSIKAYQKMSTFGVWVISTSKDTPAGWAAMADMGLRILMTNDPLGMARYAVERHNS